MNDSPDAMDEDLARLFRETSAPIADDGFSRALIERLYRRQRMRNLVLGVAAAVGVSVAGVAASAMPLQAVFQVLSGLSPGTDSLFGQTVFIALLMGGLAAFAATALEE